MVKLGPVLQAKNLLHLAISRLINTIDVSALDILVLDHQFRETIFVSSVSVPNMERHDIYCLQDPYKTIDTR